MSTAASSSSVRRRPVGLGAIAAAGVGLALALSACTGSAGLGSAAPSPSASSSPTGAPATLPDGLLVFQAGEVLATVSPDGSSLSPVTGGDPGKQHPDWSPDGQSLVFEAEFASLWTIGVDGTGAQQVFSCTSPCESIQDGAWSPDGKEIAFMTAESSDGETTSRSAILALDVASGSVRTVVEDVSGVVWLFQPRWSPDGRSLVVERDTFASDSLSEETVVRTELVIVAARGKSQPDVVATGLESPDWSPLGDALVAVRDGNLVTMDLDGGGETPLTDYAGGSPRALQPTYTPDGLSVIFTLDQGSPTAALVPVGGGEITMLGGGRLMTHTRLQPL